MKPLIVIKLMKKSWGVVTAGKKLNRVTKDKSGISFA